MKLKKIAISLFLVSVIEGYAQNPYLPLWEYTPDCEPYVFDDPDLPGKKRVYVYGSHDSMVTGYCGRELVCWSASTDSLQNWRFEGIILDVNKNARGEWLSEDRLSDVLYAPDIVETYDSKGEKMYYLYPNNMAGGRRTMVAKSRRPDGPFVPSNWSKENPNMTEGILEFDPAVFRDDDGRIYGYWGFETSNGAELDPETMATLKSGTTVVENMVSGVKQPGDFRFFEASSMRKIKDKYVFVYSRWTKDGEFGLPESNYTLAYAYSNSPLGPFTYGGTIIDGRARNTNEKGEVIPTATPNCNTHGSICEINGQWYVFYHRQSGTDEYGRQAMVAPITVNVTEGPKGKVEISEAEYTSEGFALNGLDPLRTYSAGIACWFTGPRPVRCEYPNKYFTGSYIKTVRYDDTDLSKGKEREPWKYSDPYNLRYNHNPMINNTAGSMVGYKYFNFDSLSSLSSLRLILSVLPLGIDGKIEIMVDSPWKSKGGKTVGSITLSASMPQKLTTLSADVSALKNMKGKHAIFLLFSSKTPDTSLCELHTIGFKE